MNEKQIYAKAWENAKISYGLADERVCRFRSIITKLRKKLNTYKSCTGFGEEEKSVWEELKPVLNLYRKWKIKRQDASDMCRFFKKKMKEID